jgi:hypothetical protein
VAGSCYIGSAYNAFYLPAGGNSATVLPNISSTVGSMVFGLKSAGGTAVGYSTGADGNIHAAVWTNTGTWSVADLGASGYSSLATCVNASGVVAGMWTTTAGSSDAATWTWNGSAWTVNDLINRGVTVGSGTIANFPSMNTQALKFNGDGTYTNLGNLGGGGGIVNMPNVYPMSHINTANAAMGINDSGVIVGESCITTSGTPYHAFIYGYQGVNTMKDMNTVFASIIPTGWTLNCATGIDNNGDIVGCMSNGTSNEGFLITAPAATPEPSALLLTATGLVGVLTYAWRKRK